MENLTFDLITDNELLQLAKSCEKIRSINTKKGENRRDYVTIFENYHELYIKLVTTRENLYLLQADVDQKKSAFSTTFIKELRERQEKLGLTKYLVNNVKFAFIVNIVHWLQNPELLDKKREYKPRTKNKEKIGKRNISIIKMLAMSDNSIDFEVKVGKRDHFEKIKIRLDTERAIVIDLPELKENKKFFNLNLEFE